MTIPQVYHPDFVFSSFLAVEIFFRLQSAVYLLFYLTSLCVWSYGMVVVARFMLVKPAMPPRFLETNCVRRLKTKTN